MSLSPFIWLTIGLVLIAMEVITGGFILLWFGIGCCITALLVLLNIVNGAIPQWMVFLFSSLLLLTIWLVWFKRLLKSTVTDDYLDPTLTNLTGKVIQAIGPKQEGRVELYEYYHGIKEWPALADTNIDVGTEVVVLNAKGIRLFVSVKK